MWCERSCSWGSKSLLRFEAIWCVISCVCVCVDISIHILVHSNYIYAYWFEDDAHTWHMLSKIEAFLWETFNTHILRYLQMRVDKRAKILYQLRIHGDLLWISQHKILLPINWPCRLTHREHFCCIKYASYHSHTKTILCVLIYPK